MSNSKPSRPESSDNSFSLPSQSSFSLSSNKKTSTRRIHEHYVKPLPKQAVVDRFANVTLIQSKRVDASRYLESRASINQSNVVFRSCHVYYDSSQFFRSTLSLKSNALFQNNTVSDGMSQEVLLTRRFPFSDTVGIF